MSTLIEELQEAAHRADERASAAKEWGTDVDEHRTEAARLRARIEHVQKMLAQQEEWMSRGVGFPSVRCTLAKLTGPIPAQEPTASKES